MNHAQQQSRFARLKTSLSAVFVVVVCLALGLLLLWIGSDSRGSSTAWEAVAQNCGGALIATGAISVFWDLIGRRAFATEVLAAAGTAEDVARAGIAGVSTDYRNFVDWDAMIRSASDIELAVAWANTWRESHRQAWEAWASGSGACGRVLLPDPDNAEVLSDLGRQFNLPSGEVKENILRAAKGFSALGPVEVRYTDARPVWTYYGFRDTSVVTLHTLAKAKSHDVPSFHVIRTGDLATWCSAQFEAAWSDARMIDDSRR